MSNEVGRVKSDSASFLILLQTPVHERSRHLCSERLARVSILFSRSNLMARSVSLHRFGVAHQTCLRSRTTMMTFSNSLPAQREAGSLIRRTVSYDHCPREASPHRPRQLSAVAGDRGGRIPCNQFHPAA
jgi:hypothetical protein